MNLLEVIAREKEALRRRREQLGHSPGTPRQENWFGIALSGGGIRSATINLGFLRTLTRFSILQQADYLSTVSGGGYTHAYVQGTLKKTGDYNRLFIPEHIKAFRAHGEYMAPGMGFGKNRNLFLLIVAFVVSWIMSLVSLLIVGGVLYCAYEMLAAFVRLPSLASVAQAAEGLGVWYLRSVGVLLVVHFAFNVLYTFKLGLSKTFNRIESILAVAGLGLLTVVYVAQALSSGVAEPGFAARHGWWLIPALVLLGFAANPNGLSFHRFYRKQLADLFLKFSGEHQNICLKDLFPAEPARPDECLAPYPLINTCLNLQNPSGEDKFQGVKASDFFVLSPFFCGSKITGYAPTTAFRDFRRMTLPAAVTISAAAVNPGMGVYSSKLRSAVLSLFNARLGFWVSNPLYPKRRLVWWPRYFFKELLGRIGTDNQMVNISDGGHIENLGVYELLRRGCRLVVAVDAGQDHAYVFDDLNNLILRARNELGLEIRFRPGQRPEDLIRPRPSQVYSDKRVALADIYQHWESDKTDYDATSGSPNDFPRKVGTFVYVKSSVTAPAGRPPVREDQDEELQYDTYFYKIYHPEFPHESTGDQFFDPVQWQAYYRLGQYLGADMLGLGLLGKAARDFRPKFSVEQLVEWFDRGKALFTDAERRLVATPDEGFEVLGGEEALPVPDKAPGTDKALRMDAGDAYRM